MAEPQVDFVAVKGSDEMHQTHTAIINAALNGDNTIVPAQVEKKIRVLGIKFSCASAVTTTWKSNASAVTDAYGNAVAAESFAANGGMSDLWGPWCWFFETDRGEALTLNLSGAVQVSGFVSFILV